MASTPHALTPRPFLARASTSPNAHRLLRVVPAPGTYQVLPSLPLSTKCIQILLQLPSIQCTDA